MGQSCASVALNCAGCFKPGTIEPKSEHSLKINSRIQECSSISEEDVSIDMVFQDFGQEIFVFEEEIQCKTIEKKLSRLYKSHESFKPYSTGKFKILSRNACENSVNLIEKINKTVESDKSFSPYK